MKTIKLAYHSMWPGHNPVATPPDYFYYVINQHFNIELDSVDPDIVIYSVFGPPPELTQYKTPPIVIGYSGESYDTQGIADLRLGFHSNPNENYQRLPHWVLYIDWNEEVTSCDPMHITSLITRHLKEPVMPTKWANFTYRNPVKHRAELFLKMNTLKRVDSTGPLFNNTGYLLKDKAKELSDWRFTIACENAFLPGYVTEKLLQPLAAGSLPLYWGGSQAHQDFNSKAFVDCSKFESVDHVFDYMSDLAANAKWLEYYQQPLWNEYVDWPTVTWSWIMPLLQQKKPWLV